MPDAKKGKIIIVCTIVLILVLNIVITVVTSLQFATYKLMGHLTICLLEGTVRFILMGILSCFLYKGHKWAKWIIASIFLLSGLQAIISLASGFDFSTTRAFLF